jgi:hypothetical protein
MKRRPGYKRIIVEIPESEHSLFKGLTSMRGQNMTQVIHEWILEYIKKETKEKSIK